LLLLKFGLLFGLLPGSLVGVIDLQARVVDALWELGHQMEVRINVVHKVGLDDILVAIELATLRVDLKFENFGGFEVGELRSWAVGVNEEQINPNFKECLVFLFLNVPRPCKIHESGSCVDRDVRFVEANLLEIFEIDEAHELFLHRRELVELVDSRLGVRGVEIEVNANLLRSNVASHARILSIDLLILRHFVLNHFHLELIVPGAVSLEDHSLRMHLEGQGPNLDVIRSQRLILRCEESEAILTSIRVVVFQGEGLFYLLFVLLEEAVDLGVSALSFE